VSYISFQTGLIVLGQLTENQKQGPAQKPMGQLGNISGKEAVRAFQAAGWQVRGQVGSHLMLTKAGERANLSVPQHKELSTGTLRKLIRAAGLSVEEFLERL
jgi:predicted RNA binding protein YcfA (HicA-like mRNA interferase family)